MLKGKDKKEKVDVKKIRKILIQMKEDFEKGETTSGDIPVTNHEENSFADANDLATHDTDITNEMNVKKIKDAQYEEITEALERIETDDFGVCDECGADIGSKRLEVYPTTTLCINCKEELEKIQKAKNMMANATKTE